MIRRALSNHRYEVEGSIVMNIPISKDGEPAWGVATLFPSQGEWTEEDYLALTTNHLIELSDGRLEVLPMPTQYDQLIVLFLFECLRDWARPRKAGMVLAAPMRVRLASGKFREPDVLFMSAEHAGRRHDEYWDGADFVIEVVSPDHPNRDWVQKRADYASCGIPEYWIVDPRDRTLTILSLAGEVFVERARCTAGEIARSTSLAGFEVTVADIFEQDT